MSEDMSVSLIERVNQESADMPYLAKECIDSGRRMLAVSGRDYCGLSDHCPLQGENKLGALFECRRNDYNRELSERRNKV